MRKQASKSIKIYKGVRGKYSIGKKDGFYYIHMEGFPHIPVFGSITKDKAKLREKMVECLGHTNFRITGMECE